eukprot:scaffold194284_cov27-Tisochrysis_lutea.AAC.1
MTSKTSLTRGPHPRDNRFLIQGRRCKPVTYTMDAHGQPWGTWTSDSSSARRGARPFGLFRLGRHGDWAEVGIAG